ncbi:hypothetical protein D3C76_1265040 [compost metagenome]
MTFSDFISALQRFLAFFAEMQRLSGWACPCIPGFVVRPVLNLSDTLFPGFALFFVVAPVFDHGLHVFVFQIRIVLFTAVACIRNHRPRKLPQDLSCFFQMWLQTAGIGGSLV